MRVKILHSMSGPSEVYTGGQEYDVADERASRLISRGLAEMAVLPKSREKAVIGDALESAVVPPALETTAKHRRRK